MAVGLTFLGMTVFLLLVFVLIGGPMLLTDWRRNLRQETIRRQIALTDAIDGQLGMIVSQLVRKPLWGPWEVQIAMPFSRPAVAGRILAIVNEVLAGAEGMSQDAYRVVLAPRVEDVRGMHNHRARRSAKPQASHSIGAA
jgi:hypothetical protein